MIQSINLRNFQAHKSLELELDPLVTTIIGSSDRGKSAILRALGWVATNRPAGDAFRKWNSKVTQVLLEIDDQWIGRVRSDAKNLYWLNEQRLAAFGSGVPEQIENLLRLTPINFQWQHDPPFWFSLPPGQVSKELNKIVNLQELDRIATNLSRFHRTASAEESTTRRRYEEACSKRKALSWARQADTKLQEMEASAKAVKSNKQDVTILSDLVEDGGKHQQTKGFVRNATQGWETVALCYESWVGIRSKENQLQKLVSKATTLQKIKPPPNFTRIEGLVQSVLTRRMQLNSLDLFIKRQEALETDLCQLQKTVEQSTKQLSLKFKVCPLCQK